MTKKRSLSQTASEAASEAKKNTTSQKGGKSNSVASEEQDAILKHTNGGKTTRDETDLGVPMLPGSPTEKACPEDALGDTPTRGDYSGRI